jgi:hypothetical protein
MRRSTVIEPVHIVIVVCLYATEAPAHRVTVKASYARTKQGLRVGNITHRQVLFHLADQAWMSTQLASTRTLNSAREKGQIHAMFSGVRTHFMSCSALVPNVQILHVCGCFQPTPYTITPGAPRPPARESGDML